MNGVSERQQRIESILREHFAPRHLEIEDESHKHRGHAGAAAGGGHFRVLIVADGFRGQSRIARHQAVYAALGALLQADIHALAIKALAPEEWE